MPAKLAKISLNEALLSGSNDCMVSSNIPTTIVSSTIATIRLNLGFILPVIIKWSIKKANVNVKYIAICTILSAKAML